MSDPVGEAGVRDAMRRAAAALRDAKDDLTRLDQAAGDGDLGVTAGKVAGALETYADEAEAGDDLGGFIAKAGMAANRAASSTMGTLIATALMRAGMEAKGTSDLDDKTLAAMLRAAADGVRERGKVQLGDKTVVDALHPAAEAFAEALGEGREAAAKAMARAAEEGRDRVTPQRNKIGRAGWVGERTVGAVDPGCELCVRVARAIAG